jgi:hypothetical protein
LIVAELTKTVKKHQDKHSQIGKKAELVKQSSRNGRKLIAVEIAKTVGTHQEKHSQFLETDEPVK